MRGLRADHRGGVSPRSRREVHSAASRSGLTRGPPSEEATVAAHDELREVFRAQFPARSRNKHIPFGRSFSPICWHLYFALYLFLLLE